MKKATADNADCSIPERMQDESALFCWQMAEWTLTLPASPTELSASRSRTTTDETVMPSCLSRQRMMINPVHSGSNCLSTCSVSGVYAVSNLEQMLRHKSEGKGFSVLRGRKVGI